MSNPTAQLETELATLFQALPGYNTLAPSAISLASGYVIFQQAPSTIGGKNQTQSGREFTFRYLVKGVAASRAVALGLHAQADALLTATHLTGVWNVRALSPVSYQEPLDGGAFATHAGYVYEISLTES